MSWSVVSATKGDEDVLKDWSTSDECRLGGRGLWGCECRGGSSDEESWDDEVELHCVVLEKVRRGHEREPKAGGYRYSKGERDSIHGDKLG